MGNTITYELFDGYAGPKPDVGTNFDTYKVETFIQVLDVINKAEFTFTETEVQDEIYYKKTIKNKLEIGKIGYNYLLGRVDDCVKYWVKIYKNCNGVKTLLYRAFFNNNNVEFDEGLCTCKIDLQYTSLYDCIETNRGNTALFYCEDTRTKLHFRTDITDPCYYTFADLREVVKNVIWSMNCAGYENDQLYNVESPISDFFNWQTAQPIDGPGSERTISILEDWNENAGGVLTPIPNYVNPSDDPYFIGIALKSNVLDPCASNPGVKFQFTFAEIEKMLRDVFNVYWYLVPNETLTSSGFYQVAHYLRFEHYSWFVKNVNYDAVDATNFPLNKFKNKFKINFENYPYSESWIFQDGLTDDFVGTPVIYGTCNGENKQIKHEQLNYTTDLVNILTNPAGPFENDGYFLVDLEIITGVSGGLFVKSATGLLSTITRLNGRLAIANLNYDLHRWNRPAKTGLMNFINETFLSPVYKKEQENIATEICCQDDYEKIFSLVHTQLGDGLISEAEINFNNGTIKFKLKQE